jgi:ABC-type antimicrobial peptide transport system ATPase subunit
MTALNPTMRIGPQIAEATRAHSRSSRSQAKLRAIELLGQMEFTEPERHYRLYPHELSGGTRQRVVIAIALAGSPSTAPNRELGWYGSSVSRSTSEPTAWEWEISGFRDRFQ